MTQDEWDKRVARASELATEYPFAAEVLTFYGRVAEFQKQLYDEAASHYRHGTQDQKPVREQLDLRLAMQQLPILYSIVEKHGPPGLAQAAHQLQQQDQKDRLEMLAVHAGGDGQRGEPSRFFAYTCLQPYAEYLSNHCEIQPASYTGSICPACNSRPLLAVLRPEGEGARRSLICSFCLREWNFRRIVCPACGEQDKDKLPRFSAPDFPHLRIEACDTCRTYLKSVDLTVNGLAVPLVDEIAGIPLDLWATDQGYTKIELNLVNA